jgi:hypothetical protein
MMQRQQHQALVQGRRLVSRQSRTNVHTNVNTQRRLLSSPTIVRQPMTAPPSQPPVVVSRQGWQAYRQKHPVTKNHPVNTNKKSSNNNDKTDDMPWPKSVVYGAYVAAATLIPYFSAWYVSANPAAREMVEKYAIPDVQDRLRGHFGKPDVDALSYADIIEGDNDEDGDGADRDRDVLHKLPIPHILPYEWSSKVRAEQQAIQALVSAPVNVQIQVVDDSITEDVRVQKVPGSTLARVETLLALITSPSSTSSTSSSSTAASKPNLPAIAVDFLPDDDDDHDNTPDNGGASGFSSEPSSSFGTDTTEWNNNNSTGTKSAATLASVKKTRSVDPLQQTAHIFSSWHYQPPANVPDSGGNNNKGSNNNANNSSSNNNNNTSSSVSMDDIERSRLEYTIAQLQHNLKDPNCLRSVDDMMDELKEAKADLSRLKWNKWVSWK